MDQNDDLGLSTSDSTPPNLHSLFYSSTIRGLTDWNDLCHIGSNNIDRLIATLRSDEKSLREQIQNVKTEQNLFVGRSGKDIEELAKKFENPANIVLGTPSDSHTGDPEPIDADSLNRKRGTTTFNRCWWCEYSGGGWGPYGFQITPTCRLLRNTPRAEEKGPANTSCRLYVISTEDCSKIATGMEQEIDSLRRKLEDVRTGIRMLQEIKKGQAVKPYLMTLRPSSCFNLGDRVMMYIGGQDLNDRLVAGDWAPGKVIMGYRHHDGCVSTCADFPIWKRRNYLNGAGGGYGMGRPECLLAADFYYLRKSRLDGDSRFVELWLANANDTYLGSYSHEEFASALNNGTFAQSSEFTESDVVTIHTVQDAVSALCMLCEPKGLAELNEWYRFMAGQVHPDRFDKATDEVKAYLNRQLAVYNKARELLIQELDLK